MKVVGPNGVTRKLPGNPFQAQPRTDVFETEKVRSKATSKPKRKTRTTEGRFVGTIRDKGRFGTSMIGNRQGKTEISFDLVEWLSPKDLSSGS